MRLRFLTSLAGITTVLALIGGPVIYAFHEQAQMRNFRVVRENRLYRSGQMTIAGLKRAIHDYGIQTVICLRDGGKEQDLAEEAYCVHEEINFYRLPPQSWDTTYGPAPAEENVSKFPRDHRQGVQLSDPDPLFRRNSPQWSVLCHLSNGGAALDERPGDPGSQGVRLQ